MSIDVKVEGLEELHGAFAKAYEGLEVGLRGATLRAAADGISAARQSHPYVDRTGNLSGFGPGGGEQNSHAEQSYDGDYAEMVWPSKNEQGVGYASYVDQGTRKNLAYPFTPTAIAAAHKTLHEDVAKVLEDVASKF